MVGARRCFACVDLRTTHARAHYHTTQEATDETSRISPYQACSRGAGGARRTAGLATKASVPVHLAGRRSGRAASLAMCTAAQQVVFHLEHQRRSACCSSVPESRKGSKSSNICFSARNTLRNQYVLHIKPSKCETLTTKTPLPRTKRSEGTRLGGSHGMGTPTSWRRYPCAQSTCGGVRDASLNSEPRTAGIVTN